MTFVWMKPGSALMIAVMLVLCEPYKRQVLAHFCIICCFFVCVCFVIIIFFHSMNPRVGVFQSWWPLTTPFAKLFVIYSWIFFFIIYLIFFILKQYKCGLSNKRTLMESFD